MKQTRRETVTVALSVLSIFVCAALWKRSVLTGHSAVAICWGVWVALSFWRRLPLFGAMRNQTFKEASGFMAAHPTSAPTWVDCQLLVGVILLGVLYFASL